MINDILIRLAVMGAQRALIISLVLGGLYYAMFFNDGSELEKRIADVQKEIEVQEGIKAETEQAVREVEQVRANVASLSEQFKTISSKIPTEVNMADIIKDVDGVARTAGVSIKSKEPLPVESKDFYEEIPLKITVEGTFSEVTMFLYYISSMERILKVKNFNMAGPDPNNGRITDRRGRLLLEGEIAAFRFVGEKAGEKKQQ